MAPRPMVSPAARTSWPRPRATCRSSCSAAGPRCSWRSRPAKRCRPRASAPEWCPCRAWTGSRRRTPTTSNPCYPPPSPPGCPSRPGSRSRGGAGSVPRAGRCRSSTTAPPPTPPPCSASSGSPPSTSRPPPGNPSPRPASRPRCPPRRTRTCWPTWARIPAPNTKAAPRTTDVLDRRVRRAPTVRDPTRVTETPSPAARKITMTTPQSTDNTLAELHANGVSLWLDDLSRQRLHSGNLKTLIAEEHIVGVTTNPSIFQAALKDGASYQKQIGELAARGAGVDDTVREVTTDDVRDACDLFSATFEESNHVDGRVSIEVDPRLAHDTEGTIAQAQELHKIVDRPNVLIKIPATLAGLPAIAGVKDPKYDDTRYVVELVAPNTVNTAPEKTIDAVRDHGVIRGNTIEGTYGKASSVFSSLEAIGVDLTDVFDVLEKEGVEKFIQAWGELLESVSQELAKHSS